MNNKKLLSTCSIIAILLIINGFSAPQSSVSAIKTAHLSECLAFEKTVLRLKKSVESTPLSKAALQADFKAARLAYKKIAWLIGYLDPEGEEEFNGAPLPKVELIQFTEIEPTGFQPIEEILFDEDPSVIQAELPKLKGLVQQLHYNTQLWTKRIAEQAVSDREMFEAFRVELVQMFSLSLSGFDSPVAIHSLPEAATAWRNLEQNIRFYERNLSQLDPSVFADFKRIFKEGHTYFAKNQDFNAFDRIVFYKKYLQPVYQNLLKAQRLLGIETYKLTGDFRRAWNDEAVSMFDKNFIDPKFYSNIRQNDFEDAPERIELGRLLFFDPILSINNKRACASCHNPERAFAENLPKSLDLDGKPVERNAPSLMYSALATTQFWDGRAKDVEEQMFHVTSNSREMGNAIYDIPKRLAQSEGYKTAFNKAFPNQTDVLNVTNMQKAIGAYLRSLPQFDSDFDQFMRGETSKLDPSVQRGFNVFMSKAKCGTCHFAPTFNGTVPPQYLDTEFEVIGVPNDKALIDSDLGRYGVHPAKKFSHSFKTVTVRNAALTAPYMHNGHYKNLEDVIDFYQKGGGIGLGFDVPNQTLPFDKLELSKQERRDLVKFMESLTDHHLPKAPNALPIFEGDPSVSGRKIGGDH